MPKTKKPRVPSYRFHKSSGRAVVRLSGRDIYLGAYGTPESHAKYQRVIAEWTARHGLVPRARQRAAQQQLTINEVALPYLRYAEEYYRKYGVPTSEVSSIKRAVAPLLELYGNTEVDIFGPVSLKAYRERLIAEAARNGACPPGGRCGRRRHRDERKSTSRGDDSHTAVHRYATR